MAGILSKLTSFARSPQGQRAISTATRKAQEIARDPKTKAKVDEVRTKLTARRGAAGGPGAAGSGATGGTAGGAADGTVHTDDTEGGGPTPR